MVGHPPQEHQQKTGQVTFTRVDAVWAGISSQLIQLMPSSSSIGNRNLLQLLCIRILDCSTDSSSDNYRPLRSQIKTNRCNRVEGNINAM